MAHRAWLGKPLLDIVGKPMIQHVYERALQVAGVAEVWVATDDPRVEQAVPGIWRESHHDAQRS